MILERLEKLAFGLDRNYININLVMWKVVQGMYEGKNLIKLKGLFCSGITTS